MVFLQQAEDIQTFEFLVSDGSDAGIELLLGQFVYHFNAVFVFHYGRICPWIVHRDVEIVFFQSLVDVNDLGVAHIGTVLLEGEAKDKDVGIKYLDTLLQHQLDGLGGYILAHAIVHPTASEDNLRVVTVTLGALSQIIRVHADAMATHQTGTEGQEVPLGASGFQYIQCRCPFC